MLMFNFCPGSLTRRLKLGVVAALCVLWGVSLAVPALAYESEDFSNAGTIAGTVKLAGIAPKPVRLDVSKDIEICGAHPLYDQSLVVGKNGGVRYAVVTITDISTGEPLRPLTDIQFDQKGCEYIPHVIAFPAWSSVQIINSDGILHSVHTVSTVNPVVDMAQPGFKKNMTVTLSKPEVIKVTCDAHNWMIGWWYVTGNPYYAVTDAVGHFSIANVPPGTYTLQVWQEKLGTMNKKVTVKPSATTTADFTLSSHQGS
jgi:hypothetical protein